MGRNRTKRATLRQSGDRIEMYFPSQSKDRNTECIYGIKDNVLIIAGHTIDKHPTFKNVQQFEDWCSRFFGDGKAWWENENK